MTVHSRLLSENLLRTYTNQWWYGPKEHRRDLRGELDPIDATLVGSFNIPKLRRSTKWAFVKDPLDRLEDDIWTPTGEATTVPHSSRRKEQLCAALDGILLARAGPGPPVVEAGLFPVPKPGKGDRVIFDCRPGNETLPRTHQLVLFKVEDFLVAVHRFFAGKDRGTANRARRQRKHRGVIFSLDLRHWFYQWRIGQSLRQFFGVTTRKGVYVPVVLPMGHHNAPAWAQAGAWGIALHREPDADTLGIREEDLSRIPADSSGPPYLTLWKEGKEVGRLFVLLDGISVVTCDPELGERWKQRLLTNCEIFKAVVKEHQTLAFNEKRDREAAADSESPARLDARENAGSSTAFAGVEVHASGCWRPARLGATSPLTESSSLRQWSGVLGTVFWRCRVLQCAMHEEVELRIIAAVIGQKAAEAESWDMSPDIPAALRNELNRSLEKVRDPAWCDSVRLLPATRNATCLFVAVDATETSVAWVVFNQQGEVTLKEAQQRPPGSIVVREAEAMRLGVEAALREHARHGARGHEVVVFAAGDNEGVRFAAQKRYSRNEALCAEVQALGNTDVRAIRVPTDENVADAPSRWRTLDEAARLLTWERLSAAHEEWLRSF